MLTTESKSEIVDSDSNEDERQENDNVDRIFDDEEQIELPEMNELNMPEQESISRVDVVESNLTEKVV